MEQFQYRVDCLVGVQVNILSKVSDFPMHKDDRKKKNVKL